MLYLSIYLKHLLCLYDQRTLEYTANTHRFGSDVHTSKYKTYDHVRNHLVFHHYFRANVFNTICYRIMDASFKIPRFHSGTFFAEIHIVYRWKNVYDYFRLFGQYAGDNNIFRQFQSGVELYPKKFAEK
jgi:hypothetical protein